MVLTRDHDGEAVRDAAALLSRSGAPDADTPPGVSQPMLRKGSPPVRRQQCPHPQALRCCPLPLVTCAFGGGVVSGANWECGGGILLEVQSCGVAAPREGSPGLGQSPPPAAQNRRPVTADAKIL